MGEKTEIAWTDHTFNPWWGCQRVSPGCENCYAEAFAKRTGHDVWGPEKTTERRFFGVKHWNEPLKWAAAARAAGVRRRVFCASMADVFENRADLQPERVKLWKLIEATPELDWLLLTKRPENMVRIQPVSWAKGWPPHVYAGTTAEDQTRLDERLPHLLEVRARVRFISHEPALGGLVFPPNVLGCVGHLAETFGNPLVHWVITGGESGGGARPYDMSWARSIIAQCREGGAAPFVKQVGAYPLVAHSGMEQPTRARLWKRGLAERLTYRLREAKGADPAEWPSDIRVREFPRSTP